MSRSNTFISTSAKLSHDEAISVLLLDASQDAPGSGRSTLGRWMTYCLPMQPLPPLAKAKKALFRSASRSGVALSPVASVSDGASHLLGSKTSGSGKSVSSMRCTDQAWQLTTV